MDKNNPDITANNKENDINVKSSNKTLNDARKKKLKFYIPLVIIILGIVGATFFYCSRKDDNKTQSQPIQQKEVQKTYDWDEILESGKLVVTMTRGLDSYQEVDDTVLGLQLALVRCFADEYGLELQVNLAEDTTQMINILKEKNADIIASLIPTSVIDSAELKCAGSKDTVSHLSWAIRSNLPKFEKVLNDWYSDDLRDSLEKEIILCLRNRYVVNKQFIPPYISLENDVISLYDEHFKANANSVGWDWHLIAALCYEESGFDPNAISGAGARGLMQITPSTAEKYSVKDYLTPRENIKLGCKVIAELNEQFKDIQGNERIMYVIAAYNGGSGHVRDAMALAQKNGKNPKIWNEVSFYVLHLKEPSYYRDPVVKMGFMIGDETVNHVVKVLTRWKQYVGEIGINIPNLVEIENMNTAAANDSLSDNFAPNNNVPSANKPTTQQQQKSEKTNANNKPSSANRFTKNTVILGPHDSRLAIQRWEEDSI